MLIEAPCLLGERFEHDKTWGTKGPLYLVGLALFHWGCCGMDGLTLEGSARPYLDVEADYLHREYLINKAIAFEVPDRMLFGGVGAPLREFGVESDMTGWLHGLHLRRDGSWYYTVSHGENGPHPKVRTEILDRLFSPILPAVRMTVADFL